LPLKRGCSELIFGVSFGKPLFCFCNIIGVMIKALLGRFVNMFFSASDEEVAERANARETDKNVDYVVVKTWDDVGELLLEFVEKYNEDIADYDDYDFVSYYDFVRSLPYKEDLSKVESSELDVYCRPKRTLSENCECRDCDDKAILLACWCYRHNVPFRFLACSYEKANPVEHCIIEVKDDNEKWIEVDATYEEDTFPSWRKYYNKIYLAEWS